MVDPQTTIGKSPGVRLVPTKKPGISKVEVLNEESRYDLPWDRFMRFDAVSSHLRRIVGDKRTVTILDVGGFDGAFAMFVPGHEVHIVDSATTGGSGLNIPVDDKFYQVVVSIDAIEHLATAERGLLLAEIARVTAELCMVNFPHASSLPVQKLILSLTNNPYIREHVELGLPERGWVCDQLSKSGLSCQAIPNTSLAMYVSQFTLQNILPDKAAEVSRYLVRTHREEPFSAPLYLLVIATR